IGPPRREEADAEPGALDPLEPDGGDDLVGVHVGAVEGDRSPGDRSDCLHRDQSSSGRAKWPATPGGAATAGDTRWVRPPAPWRPSKLRLDVEAQRSPGPSTSGFMPRHMEQPAARHSNPAAANTRSRPSASAAALTAIEPGTTMARNP